MRGTSLLGTLAYARDLHGEAGVQRLLAALPEDSRRSLSDGSTLPGGWYDTALVVQLTQAVDDVFGKRDLALARAVGRHVAFADVSRFFKWIFRLAGPALLFSRATSIWSNYYDDGRYVFEGIAGSHAAIRIEAWPAAHPALCRRVEGWIERALELTLGSERQPRIREEGHLVRDAAVCAEPFCRFVADWADAPATPAGAGRG